MKTHAEKCSRTIIPLSLVLMRMANDWHEIDPVDKGAIAKLGRFGSFQGWASPLKAKCISEEKASNGLCDVSFQLLKDKVKHRHPAEVGCDRARDASAALTRINPGHAAILFGKIRARNFCFTVAAH